VKNDLILVLANFIVGSLILLRQNKQALNIETIKGIGENLAPSLVGSIGVPERFSSQSKLRCFARASLKCTESGFFGLFSKNKSIS
jgi:hypothetical protein